MFKFFTHLVGTLALLLILLPQNLFAAELLFKSSSDPLVIEVRIDPQSKEMNVIEGTIRFSGTALDGLAVQVENGQSILPIWPTPPQYDGDTKSIMFVGGVPNGFSSEGLLFRLRLSPTILGNLIITYIDGSGYLNDGNGTKEGVFSKPFEMYVDEEGIRKINEDSFGLNKFNYVIIILLVAIILFFIFRYVF